MAKSRSSRQGAALQKLFTREQGTQGYNSGVLANQEGDPMKVSWVVCLASLLAVPAFGQNGWNDDAQICKDQSGDPAIAACTRAIGMRSLETGRKPPTPPDNPTELERGLTIPHPERLWHLLFALEAGYSVEGLAEITRIDPWFLNQLEQIVDVLRELKRFDLATVPAPVLREAKRLGVADAHLAEVWGGSPEAVRTRRLALGVKPVFKRVDTCAAEFESFTPYLYSTYEDEDEAEPTDRRNEWVHGLAARQ